jgi:hypothetical protein
MVLAQGAIIGLLGFNLLQIVSTKIYDIPYVTVLAIFCDPPQTI